jgi:hypothetical protein
MPPEGPSRRTSFAVYDLALYVPVNVGSLHTMAQIDTGSSGTLVTRSFSANLPEVSKSHLRGAFRQVRTRKVRLPALRWAGRIHPNLVANVRPDFQEDLPFKAGVTLGNSILLARPLYVDFETMTIGFGRSRDYRPILTAPLETIRGLPFIHLTVGRRVLHAAFDLGAGVSVLNRRIFFPNQEKVLTRKGEDTTRETRKFTLYRGPTMSLKGQSFGRAEYAPLDLREVEGRLGSPLDFALGVNMLLRIGGTWRLDAHAGRIQWG